MRLFSRAGLRAGTAAAMATSTFPIIVVSVLPAQLIDEFVISRAQVGPPVTASGLVGALVSPLLGQLTDRLGAVRSVVGTLVGGGPTLTAMALSPSYGFLVAAAIPLFANDELGWSEAAAGTLIAIVGLTGIIARLYWRRLSERSMRAMAGPCGSCPG